MTEKPQITARVRYVGEAGRTTPIQGFLKLAGDSTPCTVSGSLEGEIFRICIAYTLGLELRFWDQYKEKVSIGMEVSLLDERKRLLGHGIVIAVNSAGLKMHGSFNGVGLSNITSKQVTLIEGGKTLFRFRVTEFPDDLEPKLRLGAPALLVLSDENVEGTIAHYSGDAQSGYEITIESPSR
jgi:hypothetical protein